MPDSANPAFAGSLATDLVPKLEQVLVAAQVDRDRQRILACLTRRDSCFTLDNDPALVKPLVAFLQEDLLAVGTCDRTGATRVCAAVQEALLNALYHGSLEVPPGLRQSGKAALQGVIDQRRRQHPYCDRRVQLTVHLTPTEASYMVADQGPGFDRSLLPDPTCPENLENPDGRGILLMNTFMDRVTYNAKGNEVTLIKRRDGKGGRAAGPPR